MLASERGVNLAFGFTNRGRCLSRVREHRKLFKCCFMIDDKLVKESRFAYSSGLINTFIFLFPKDVDSINVIFNVKGIANMNSYDIYERID